MAGDLVISALELLRNNIPAVLLLLVIGGVFYDVHLHPLARFPGPFWARISRLWWLRVVLSGSQHLKTYELHEKYGPVVRITPNSLSFSDHRAIKTIYGRGPNALAKGDQFGDGFLPGGEPPVFFAREPALHAWVKKRIAHAYSMTSVMQMEPSVTALVDEFLEHIDGFAERDEEFDLVKWMNHLTFDLISELGYGKKFGFMATGGDVNGYQESLHGGFTFFAILGAFPSLMKIFERVIKFLPPPPSGNKIGHLLKLANNLITTRQTSPPTHPKPDLLTAFLASKTESGEPLPHSAILGEVMSTLIAGADTTAAYLQGASMYLLRHPSVLQRLVHELDSAPPASYTDTLALPYFQAVVKEVTRLSPSVASIFCRKVPQGGMELLPGVWVEGEYDVGINNWVVGRDKTLYGADAEEFRPERWLEGGREKFGEWEFGFGGGTRVCIGRNVALMEICKTLPQLFWRFELELVEPEKMWVEKSRLFLYKSGMKVRARKRVPAERT